MSHMFYELAVVAGKWRNVYVIGLPDYNAIKRLK